MAVLIKGGEIVIADSRFHADIFIEHETISSISKEFLAPPGTDVIDARGKLVFPGFIDPHVHIHLPFMATFAKDTHRTASKAALLGGTTTFIEMCCPSRNEDALEGYNLWKEKAEGHSACDYAFHMAVTRFDAQTETQLRGIAIPLDRPETLARRSPSRLDGVARCIAAYPGVHVVKLVALGKDG